MSEKHVLKASLVVPPCRAACPAGIDVPRYIRRIKEGKFDEALAVIRERIPFPSICGYACFAPCETDCANKQFGNPIAIRALKRSAAEEGGQLWRENLTIATPTGKKVAVVGAGPSGLTAAYYLAVLGHQVTVFEVLDRAGGMMQSAIPAYRLPRENLDSEINDIKGVGVEIKTGQQAAAAQALLQDGFDSVYVACGLQKGAKLGIDGEDLDGMLDGLEFLKAINRGDAVTTGNRVAVIGGGNTAVDAARSAVRLGADDVSIIYRRSSAEMPALKEEVAAALEEGVKIQYLTIPTGAVAKNGALEVTLARMELGKPDAGGRPVPILVDGSEFVQEFDTVIAAIGQVLTGTRELGVALDKKGNVQADLDTLATDTAGVYAGGDLLTGPASIIDAIAQGRTAAQSIDRYLGGTGVIDQPLTEPEEEVVLSDFEPDRAECQIIACLPIDERKSGFGAVELGLTADAAVQEAYRCLNCDARRFEVSLYGDNCKDCSYCAEVCGLDVFAPAENFNAKGYRPMEVKHPERCVGCNLCYYACPDFAIDIIEAA